MRGGLPHSLYPKKRVLAPRMSSQCGKLCARHHFLLPSQPLVVRDIDYEPSSIRLEHQGIRAGS